MARGRYSKKRNGKGGLVLMLIVTMLVIGACAVGIFMVLNKEEQPQPGYQPAGSTTQTLANQTEQTTPVPTTQPTEVTTVPTEETVPETTEATVPETTEATTLPTLPEDAGIGENVAYTALSQVGKPYKSGGNGPDNFDTTGFVCYCLKENGLISKRTKTKQLAQEGTEVAKEDLQPGDVVFFWTSNEGQAEYAGIYVGDGKFVAARNEENPVSELDFNSNYFQKRYVTARRFEK